MRTENCVCGGTITVSEDHSPAPYIEGHNSTPSHFAWRLRYGISRERPTADPMVCDLSASSARASAVPVRRVS